MVIIKNYKQTKPFKNFHELSMLYFIAWGVVIGFIFGAFTIGFLGSPALVFGISFGVLMGFIIKILLKHYQ